MIKIAAVIVTFNRKQCLLTCLQAIFRQTYPPKITYIIDNASTDGTFEYLLANGVKLKENNSVKNGAVSIFYLRLPYNMGGAGGFYYGIKKAYEQTSCDAVWVMDDDGIPMDNCLEMMVPYLTHYDYVSPMCIAKENPKCLAFDHKGELCVKKYIETFAKDGIIKDDGFPFNGVMYSRYFIKTVGFPKKELFIWGDEANYSKRAKKVGFSPITVVKALHYHPFNRADYVEISIFGHIKRIIVTNSSLRFYCMHRNAAYNARIDGLAAIKNLLIRYVIFTKYYLYISHKPFLWFTFNRAFFAGLLGYFGGHKKYLKKKQQKMKTIAFIPVRGGSKSIPLKNIKPFCDKPLVCWNIEALEKCLEVDEIIVATDSDKIEEVVKSQSYQKTNIYRRSAESACDTASTESVMLEYINYAQLPKEDLFMLVQATSPMTESIHFSEALKMYGKGEYDSIITCVRNYRFFWNENGTSMNYDYMNRPRRQNFNGMLMENGAFYINKVENILSNGNRLGGKIGIYEMPEYTATEIDEPDDWIVLENLMRKHVLNKQKVERKKIKIFLCDVDGTLTDGGMYYSEKGDELKKFNTRDGMGFQMLREIGIKTGIITSEITKIVENRAKKLKVDFLFQGKHEGGKLEAVNEICHQMGISFDEVAYIGDDINCFELLTCVGYAACPFDASEKIKKIQNIRIMSNKGGEGCVREFIESLII